MDHQPQFLDLPCGHYGNYTFHKGFKYFKHGKFRTLSLGEFFFVRISANHDPCIGELELLWTDENNDQRLSSLRLYFLPEQTPEGRHSAHGQDEVLSASDKVVLRLEDLVGWITDQVEWNHGLLAFWSEEAVKVLPLTPPSSEEEEISSTENDTPNSELTNGVAEDDVEPKEPALEEKPPPPGASPTETPSPTSTTTDEAIADIPSSAKPEDEIEGESNSPVENDEVEEDKDKLRVMVLSFPSYCRYKTTIKRLEGMADKWMMHNLVIALGGFGNLGRNTHILFCRDMFDHEELANHELNCDYLAPTLKMKKRKKKSKTTRSTSPGSESNTSEENKDTPTKLDMGDNFKQPPCKTEQEFLQRLYKFMKKKKTPIHRVPHLGFKQIDLFVFYSFAQKLGGYDKITTKRLWKHVYDVLGGDPGSTSAATCTRRHYERLLLPFERFMDGKEYKPKQSRKQAKPQKKVKDENENDLSEKSNATMVKSENDDAYAFTDSNHENSKDSFVNEEMMPSGDEDIEQSQENYSDEDSKSIWSIQRSLDGKEDELEKNGSKSVKPLIIQKEQNESFSEKERKWNEIRRKNALARKWVRQLRPSRGGKMPGSEKFHDKEISSSECKLQHNMQDMIKSELKEGISCSDEVSNAVKPTLNSQLIKQEPFDPSTMEQLPESFKSMPIQSESRRSDFNKKSSYFAKATDAYLSSRNSQLLPKTEVYRDKNSWCGYTRDGVYQIAPAPERYPYPGFDMNMIHTYMKHDYKSKNENGPSKAYTVCNNSSESIALSSSELETSSVDGKMTPSQRRPSVIQHTEYVTSPCQSPKMGSDGFPESFSRDMHLSISPSSKIAAMLTNNLAHTMTGKVTEWLAKSVPEAVACKTPCSSSEKAGELHDKVLMPSSCKTPGPGTGKVPMYLSKNKVEQYVYPGTLKKSVRDKGSTSYRQAPQDALKRSAGYISSMAAKINPVCVKTFQPISVPNVPMKTSVKPEQPYPSNSRNKMYNCNPAYCPPKRHKLSNPVQMPTPLPHRPSLLSFTQQQTYRTSPLSDIPKSLSTEQSDYSGAVLDLSVKKKPAVKVAQPIILPVLSKNVVNHPGDMCLDLSVKNKSTSFSYEKAIENITPPLPSSPQIPPHPASYTSKPLPTLIALQDLMRQEASSRQIPSAAVGSSSQPTIPISSSTMPPNSVLYAANAQSKIHQNYMTPLSEAAFSKEMAKSLYRGPDQAQFSPFVIPPFYTANWVANNKPPGMAQSSNSSAAASPNPLRETINPAVFPKQYVYRQQFPFVCKDNGYYPPSCK